MTAPLTGTPPSPARSTISSAIASGEVACAITSSGRNDRFTGVSISCGATAFTRIPCGRSSRSSTRTRWLRAALLRLYAATPAYGSAAQREDTNVIEPEPRFFMYGATAWVSHSAGPTLTSIICRNWSGVADSASPMPYVPMVFTSTSGGPTSAATRLTTAFATAGSVASPGTWRTPSGSSLSPSALRSTPATVNPAPTSFTATDRPSGPPAPTTNATRSLIVGLHSYPRSWSWSGSIALPFHNLLAQTNMHLLSLLCQATTLTVMAMADEPARNPPAPLTPDEELARRAPARAGRGIPDARGRGR